MKNLQIEKDLPNKKITVTRHFEAAPEQVWRAWTEADLLDKWWAPKPWRAETKSMSFTEGGQWLYAMVGPEGEKHWAKVDFISIHPVKSFSAADSFCDENGNTNTEFPRMHWHNQFYVTNNGTKVVVEISFTKDADLETILTMGFESGFTSALTNLDDYFSSQSDIR